VTEGWKSIRLNQFEHVVTGPSQSLLRVNGRTARRRSPGPRPVLVIGTTPAHRFAPLRAPEDRSRFLHAAYPVPTALVHAGAPCWLEFEDGFRIELPVPEEGTARMRDGQIAEAPPLTLAPPLTEAPPTEAEAEARAWTEAPPETEAPPWTEASSEAEAEPTPWTEAPGETEAPRWTEAPAETQPAPEGSAAPAEPSQADDESAALRQRIDELERARDDDQRVATASAAQIQTRLEAAEQRAETAEHELLSAQAEAQTAQQRAEAADHELQSAQAQAQTAQQRAETAEHELQSAQARAQTAEEQIQTIATRAQSAVDQEQAALARAAELEQKDQTRKARVEALEHDLAEVAPVRDALERDVSKLRASQSSLKQELEQARDQLRVMTFERDELSRQAAAFDAVAVKARDRAGQAETANEKTTATLRELQTWRGELERRLAETTSELGAARAAREDAERELQRLRASLADRDRLGSEAPERTNGGEQSETVAAQAEEIEHLASELAALRARVAREP
jgi:hypothetical protein